MSSIIGGVFVVTFLSAVYGTVEQVIRDWWSRRG